MTRPSVAIIVAMESELRHARERMDDVSQTHSGPWVGWDGTLDGVPVTLVLSGIGMVNASAATSTLLAKRNIGYLLNYGCAGAHRADIHPGDVILADRYLHHRAVAIRPDGTESYLGFRANLKDQTATVESIPAHSQLLAFADDALHTWSPEYWPGDDIRTPEVHCGPITSADCWTQHEDLIQNLNAQYGTLCEDMEAAAIAHVALLHEVPFLAIKDISNNELHAQTSHGDDGPSLASVEAEVGKRAFGLLHQVIRRIAE